MLLALLNPTHFVSSSGYLAVFLLSVLQSCCVPTSSELTLGFAGVLAAEGKLSLAGAIAAGAGGELVGAYIAWIIGRTGGRAFVDRYGKYILLSHRDLDRAEAWYDRHDRFGVLGSRLLPVIRNFVALPAGVAEVPLVRFGVLTAVGSIIWDGAMALIGYEVGGKWKSVMHGVSYAGYLLGALVVLALAFLLFHRYRSYKEATAHGAPRAPRPAPATQRVATQRVARQTPAAQTLRAQTVSGQTVAAQPAAAATNLPAAGWYPDPMTPDQHRYWTGTAWSTQVAPAGQPAAPATPATVAVPASEPTRRRGQHFASGSARPTPPPDTPTR